MKINRKNYKLKSVTKLVTEGKILVILFFATDLSIAILSLDDLNDEIFIFSPVTNTRISAFAHDYKLVQLVRCQMIICTCVRENLFTYFFISILHALV